MKLSIVTINYNNVVGVQKTLQSVFVQTCHDIEHVVVDGGSNDGSRDAIKDYANKVSYSVLWVSEPDQGIYNAMNKGLRMSTGDYIQILNSGDCLASNDIIERMLAALEEAGNPSILYGNMVKCFSDGRKMVDKCFAGQEITMLGMYTGTLNHDPAYIRRDLFEKYGYYDENLKIVSDWKWYMQAIVLGVEKPKYVDLDVTLFDMSGISEVNLGLRDAEKRQELEKMLPLPILADYDKWHFPIEQMRRIKCHPWAYKLVWLLERVLFKFEKWNSWNKSVQKVN